MQFETILVDFLNWVASYRTNLLATCLALVGYVLVTRITLPRLTKSTDDSGFKSEQVAKAYHMVRLVCATVTIAVVLLIWGIDFSGLLIFSTSIITLLGVALFASWSILSNVTSFFILLFHTSFRRGNYIRVIDADNYIEGYIAELGLLNTKLTTSTNEHVVYPNNLLLARPVFVNPDRKLNALGKITDSLVIPKASEHQPADEGLATNKHDMLEIEQTNHRSSPTQKPRE
ncbi:MAG: mechanosensitive ion channel family protein [Paraglaciecola sp.]|uniref:mechanosensitive ion channel domain-containing protein n=1 Tax=Paraglaciecola sp. TaxID=1920173 RepID=UPI00273E651C|nr:mechanosensitive ion channel domain-containing protein [Paraglaciecola sp.]MDP5032952.1 mechanosensitive ion channel family protein [Paraglaciecola sp.]MDP5133679.1 mechanosensitive ion channel family protein [Paraglaciecola sp.]